MHTYVRDFFIYMTKNKFTLFIHSNYTNAVYNAYQFAKTALEQNHELAYIFFWRESVLIANKNIILAGDDVNLQTMWQELSKKNNLALHICKASASRRGIQEHNLAFGFQLGSIAVLSEHLTSEYNLVSF